MFRDISADGNRRFGMKLAMGPLALLALIVTAGGCDGKKGAEEADRACSAIVRGEFETAKTLVNTGIDINVKTPQSEVDKSLSGRYIIAVAVEEGWTDGVRFLISKGAKLDVRNDGDGATPLALAVSRDSAEMVELLLNAGADPNYLIYRHLANGDEVSSLRRKPITVVNMEKPNHRKIIDLLLAKGADINARDGVSRTLMHSAAEMLSQEDVEFLLGKGADINVKDKDGQSPCAAAVQKHGWGKPVQDFVAFLKSKGATDDVNTIVRENLSR